MRNKKVMLIASMIVIYMIICVFNITDNNVNAASTLEFKWKKNDTIDKLLQVVKNKAGDNEAFLSWKFDKYGTYTLEYYLDDYNKDSKIDKTVVTFKHEVDKVIISYNILDGDTNTSILQGELDKSYAVMNYELMVPQLETKQVTLADPSKGLTFTINKVASSKYPGASFVLNNIPVRFKWDLQTKSIMFFTKGVKEGLIVPFELTNPDNDKEEIQLLRKLAEFNIQPTHWIKNGSANQDLKFVEIPTSSDRPGSKPGLRITFKRPFVFDKGDNKYKVANDADFKKSGKYLKAILALRDIQKNGDNADIIIELDDDGGQYINPPNSGSVTHPKYRYDSAKQLYTLEIVKDRTGLDDGQYFLQWDKLDSSRVYSASVSIEESPKYQFHEYEPIGKYAFTYLDYVVKRASMDNAYLDIVPYAGSNSDDLEYTVYYSKTERTDYNDDDIWLKHYHKKEYSDSNIYIPVPFTNGSAQDYYQIGVQFAGAPLRSQTIRYLPKNDKNVPPPVPRIKEIKSLAVVPPSDPASKDPQKVQFDLEWHAPAKDLLDNMLENNGELYYEMLFNNVPVDDLNNKFTVVKIFKVYKDRNEIKVQEVANNETADNAKPLDIGEYNFGYNANENLFQMKDIVIKGTNGWSDIPNRTFDAQNKIYTYSHTDNNPYSYQFPGVNYIRMRAVYKSRDGVGESDKSIADSISLSMIKYDIPIPGQIQYSPVTPLLDSDPLGIKVKFKLIDIRNYESYMLYPLNKKVNDITYSVYISEDKNKILNVDNFNEENNPVPGTPADPTNIFYKTTDSSSPVDLSKAEIGYLRNDKVLYFDLSTTPNEAGFKEIVMHNLDPNTNYYVRIVSKLNIAVDDVRRSSPSSMLSATSPVIPSNPGDNELVPLAPVKIDADYYDESMTVGEITWELPSEIALEEDKYGSELIAIEGKSLPDSLKNGIMLQDILDSELLEGDDIQGWRLYEKAKKYILKYYDKDTNSWVDATQTFKVEGNKITIIDDNNLPNKVYYYYARIIKIRSEVPKATSAWVVDTLTTAPIKRPINLIVAHQSEHSYNPKNEVIIRFDAPVPSDYYITDEYAMEVYVKGDNDLDYSDTKYPGIYITQVDGANDGYTRIYYRITGLKPGKTYKIKVRIQDKTKEQETLPNGNQVYPRSSFSEKITTRTEFDQVDYEKENKYLQYIKYYQDKAAELKNVPYWEIESSDTTNIVKYRKDYNIGELKYITDGKYLLVDASKNTNIYYLPAKMIETANDKGITIFAKFPNGDIGIRPFTISKDETAEIIEKIEEINKYDNNTKDYYIKLIINRGKYNNTVLGKKPSTDLVNYELQIIGSNKTEDDFDRLSIQKFDQAIANKKSYLINELDKELVTGIDDTKLLKIVTETLNMVKKSYRADMKALVNQYIQKKYSVISTINNTIRIAFDMVNSTDVLQAYQKDGNTWSIIESNKYGNKYNIETRKQGAYILAPRSSEFDSLDDVYNGRVTDVIVKYNLMDIFSSDELNNLDTKVAKYQIFSSTARILGASKGNDNIQWLQDNNIKVTKSNLYGNMTREEALYLFMQAYSIKNDIILDYIPVTNYNIIEDINKINRTYQEVILKGVNLGVIKLNNGRILPNEQVDIELVLEMLTKINNKIDW
ncbi:MAG: hypothetical protein N4A50_06780 [Vallitalea sp.]|jgi:hypothetical protein|nr:hypothetical protein [Vallitalea sp.]